jgi:hypothetical protein
MSSKVFLDDKLYRISIFTNIRRRCDNCSQAERDTTLLVRLLEPEKKEIAICYRCLLEWVLIIDGTNQRAAKAKKRIASKKQLNALALAREAKKGKKNGVLSPVLANTEGPPSEIEKENGNHRAGTGRTEDGIVFLSETKN